MLSIILVIALHLLSIKLTVNYVYNFTLSELWLEWIEDEMKICADDRAAITDLFDKAVQDYMCEYSQNIIKQYLL